MKLYINHVTSYHSIKSSRGILQSRDINSAITESTQHMWIKIQLNLSHQRQGIRHDIIFHVRCLSCVSFQYFHRLLPPLNKFVLKYTSTTLHTSLQLRWFMRRQSYEKEIKKVRKNFKKESDTYVGFRYFGLQICDRSECSQICLSMLIEAAHLVKSTLFRQSETVKRRNK